jgi:hypothetical protein
MNENSELQKLKQQIIFSQMPISEKDFWLLIIKKLKEEDAPIIRQVLEKYKEKNTSKLKIYDLKSKKNETIKKYNDEVIAKIKKTLDNMISDELKNQDKKELEKIRNYFNGLNNGNQ